MLYFNVHWNAQHKSDVKQFSRIISSADLTQHVNKPTHTHGNILDHVFSLSDDNLVSNCYVDENYRLYIPEGIKVFHYCVLFNVNFEKPLPVRVTSVVRKYTEINES